MIYNSIKLAGAVQLIYCFYFNKAFKYLFYYLSGPIQSTSLTQELSSNQLCVLDEFDVGQREIFPGLKNASLEVTQFCMCVYMHIYICIL